MKKLMIAAVAGVCASVFGLESANVVGYTTQKANATRNTMMAPTFLSVDSATGCKLSDLTVTGYDAPEWIEDEEYYENGCYAGDFVLQFLNNNGSVAARYYWIDDGDNAAGWYGEGGRAIEGGAESVSIPAGTAAWTIGTGKTLQSAGAVNTADVEFKMNNTRNTAVGNCMPTEVKLSSLTVTGYDAPEWIEDEEYYENGCYAGDFVLQFLKNDGTVETRYYWIDDGDNAAGWYGEGGKAIEGGAASVSIPAGKGAWVIGTGKKLVIPAPAL